MRQINLKQKRPASIVGIFFEEGLEVSYKFRDAGVVCGKGSIIPFRPDTGLAYGALMDSSNRSEWSEFCITGSSSGDITGAGHCKNNPL